MKKYLIILITGIILIFIFTVYRYKDKVTQPSNNESLEMVTVGTKEYRGFILDNVLHSKANGDIHYNVYIPSNYDGKESYALYLTLPGYQGLYFQGVGMNLKTEDFGFVAQDYNEKMIIVAPQLNDWQEMSANQTIALVEYFLSHYNIDKTKVYANGYSGGGETMSIVMSKRADLFTAYLHASSKWDGDFQSVVDNQTPVYFVVGESDEYYGMQPSQEAYDTLYALYKNKGLTDNEINKLLVLDIKDKSYFQSQGIENQHGQGAGLFAEDKNIMGWLFSQSK